MKIINKTIVIMIILFLATSIFFGCETANQDNFDYSAWPEMPANTNPNLQYFGYYHFADCIEEVAALGNANIAKTDARDVEEIEALTSNGFKVFIMIRYVFFEDGETPSDVEERWDKAKQDITPYIENIIGFYVDEPRLTGKSESAFHYACQTVRADYPDKKMMAVMALPALLMTDSSARYFRYCTDIGYDLYMNWDENAVAHNVAKLRDEIAVYGQSIWLIPKAFYHSYSVATYIEDSELFVGEDVLRWIKGSYCMAVADPRIVGIFAFVYDNDGYEVDLKRLFMPDSDYYNAEVRAVYLQIGKMVIG